MSVDRPDDDVWTRRINAFWNGVFRVVQILTPLIAAATLYYSAQNKTAIEQAKDQVSEVAADAAKHARKAAEATKEVKTDLDESRQERKEQFNSIAEKQDADLKAWKAYHTKEPEDMNRAQEALHKAIGPEDIGKSQ